MFSHRRRFSMGETAQQQAAVRTRQPIPAVASLAISPERLERMWKMTAQERVAAARQGKLTLGEMIRWAAHWPSEVDPVDGEWWFITALLADTDEGEHGNVPQQRAARDTSQTPAAAARDTPSSRSRRCAS